MGYAHIDNLYRPRAQSILLFSEVWALEKIHGTSAHVRWADGQLHFSSGGASPVTFRALFDEEQLAARFRALGHATVIVYGEAYGGKEQKQAWRYGPSLKFVAFDVQLGAAGWLTVPNAHNLVAELGLDFVHYDKSSTALEALDTLRDAPSTQAMRNGMGDDKPREGVILRPLMELTYPDGERICAKHKRAEERETATPREVVDPSKMATLADANAIALEWVTDTRLEHVLDKIPKPLGHDVHQISQTPLVIKGMQEDVLREGAGELIDSKEARKAIGDRARVLFHAKLQAMP
jgi:hypothetical protein